MSHPEKPWWKAFFDRDYARLWSGFFSKEQTERQVDGIWNLLQLTEQSKVLDAPCGYGRLSRPLAQRGAEVLGADQSQDLVDQAEKERGALPDARLRYICHDLRKPLAETGFDAALNIFTSLGYGSEEDDLAILKTLHQTLKPGGLLLVETMHRDLLVATLARGAFPPMHLADGTIMIEEAEFDAVTGRVETTWYWSGPAGQGQKPASLRVYSATELVHLVQDAGFQFLSAHSGCSTEPFKAAAPDMGGRIGILVQRRR